LDVHYLALFWNWMPTLLRNYFIVRFLTGWGWLNRPDRELVGQYADSVNLLDARQMEALFPGCTIFREKFLGMTKSLIAVKKARKEPAVAGLSGETFGMRPVESSGEPLGRITAALGQQTTRPLSETRG
jgi:hypothetical protein